VKRWPSVAAIAPGDGYTEQAANPALPKQKTILPKFRISVLSTPSLVVMDEIESNCTHILRNGGYAITGCVCL
jgi:hypothetical protein